MRKIDTEAYNKRLHTEIMELDKMIKSISPENINNFDASLIESANNYIKLISDATWDNRSNINGIELHKIKDLLSYLKIKKTFKAYHRIYLDTDLNENDTADGGIAIKHIMHSIPVDEGFDGRKSLVVPKMIWYRGNTVAGVANLFQIAEPPIIDEEIYSNKAATTWYVRKSQAKIDIEYSGESVIYKALYENPRVCSAALSVFYILWK